MGHLLTVDTTTQLSQPKTVRVFIDMMSNLNSAIPRLRFIFTEEGLLKELVNEYNQEIASSFQSYESLSNQMKDPNYYP